MFSNTIIPNKILIFNVYHPTVVIILVFYQQRLGQMRMRDKVDDVMNYHVGNMKNKQ